MITNINEAKEMTKYIWSDYQFNTNSIVQYMIQIKNGIIKHANVNVKN